MKRSPGLPPSFPVTGAPTDLRVNVPTMAQQTYPTTLPQSYTYHSQPLPPQPQATPHPAQAEQGHLTTPQARDAFDYANYMSTSSATATPTNLQAINYQNAMHNAIASSHSMAMPVTSGAAYGVSHTHTSSAPQ